MKEGVEGADEEAGRRGRGREEGSSDDLLAKRPLYLGAFAESDSGKAETDKAIGGC